MSICMPLSMLTSHWATAMLKLFLLFVVAVSSEASKQCINIVPGLSKIAEGVDIAQLDLLPLEFTTNNGILSPIFPLTCDQGKKWKSPSGILYDMPDQIWTITTVPGGHTTSEVDTFKSYNDVRESMSANAGLEASYGFFAFSGSFSYRKLQSLITSSSMYMSEVTAFAGAIRADVNAAENLELDTFTQNYIDRFLTDTYESNPDAYNKFIETYGTHYFATGKFGGYVRMMFEASQDYYSSQTEIQIEANARASYMLAVSVSVGTSTTNQKVDETFKSNTKKTIKYYGGNTNLLNDQPDFSKWLPTVENDPWLFSGNLKPISNLFRNATKKASMVAAVENHLIRSYLGELQYLINVAKSKSDNFIIRRFLTTLNDLKATKVIPKPAVEGLSRDLQELMSVPKWFLASTKLCLHWLPTGDRNQCGGTNDPQDICANINSMTEWYHDSTDQRSGGCKMQWGIYSLEPNPPEWLHEIKICYQWDLDKSINDDKQCGIGKGYNYCGNINSLSNEYLDDTSQNRGGCKIRWMLEIPGYVPYWMKVLQVCFKWEAEGEAAQCGGGAPPYQCVPATNWTEYYVDYTDDRAGGCKLSWGLKTSY